MAATGAALSVPSAGYLVSKLVFERALALLLLVLLAVLLLIVAISIKLDSPGPVFFRQVRYGLNGKTFRIWKFRTMQHRPDNQSICDGSKQATRADVRITWVGRILRKYSIDEVPQLINVLAGDMALVGPRPHAVTMRFKGYLLPDVIPHYMSRYSVIPGITGWAQVNGRRGETSREEQITDRIRFDLEYINNWSFLLDLRILFLTIAREIISDTAF